MRYRQSVYRHGSRKTKIGALGLHGPGMQHGPKEAVLSIAAMFVDRNGDGATGLQKEDLVLAHPRIPRSGKITVFQCWLIGRRLI